MTFTEITNKVYFLTSTDSNSYPIADLTRSANSAVERVVSLINGADSRWQFDDTNQTDLPVATATLTAGQQDYALATSHISIDRVEVKDESGNWHVLSPIDVRELTRDKKQAISSYKSTNGIPEEYDKMGNSIFLYPAPSYTQASSLKVFFTRPPVAFTTSDTTATPGFNSLFHTLIPLWASYDYAVAYRPDLANGLMAEINRLEKEVEDFYGLRARDFRPRMTVSTDSNR